MYWKLWLIASIAILFGIGIWALILSKLRYKSKRLLTPNKLLFFGVFSSSATLLGAIFYGIDATPSFLPRLAKAIMRCVQHALRLFAMDGDYTELVEILSPSFSEELLSAYSLYLALLYVAAPLLTFGAILSFFKNIASYRRYLFFFGKETFVFSELNEKTLALAKSIDKKHNQVSVKNNSKTRYRWFRRALIVFTDVLEKNEELHYDLVEEAKEMQAILFRKDLSSIHLQEKWRKRNLSFFLVSDDEAEKNRHATTIMKNYDQKNVKLHVFSEDVRSELLLASKRIRNMKVIRVNDIQELIYHNLDLHGTRLFRNARDIGNGEKMISAVIVGLGRYGIEMLKALSWFCQMPGYRLKIHAFDSDPYAEDRIRTLCPELMDERINGQVIEGDAYHEIHVYPNTDVNSPAFANTMRRLRDTTYIFVCLGEDQINISAAVRIRSLCESISYVGHRRAPDIETVVYDTDASAIISEQWQSNSHCRLSGAINTGGQSYRIHMIGDLTHFYDVDTVINFHLIQEGKSINTRWSKELASNAHHLSEAEKREIEEKCDRLYWRYEYNYRSSNAKALHERLRKKLHEELGLHISGVGKTHEEIISDPTLRLAVGKLEHIRWNAYMRSEGYCYGNKKDHLAKTHYNLVPVDQLTDDELRLDA